jgi:hypothetical protein
MRDDYALRSIFDSPPTVEEVLALASLWGNFDNAPILLVGEKGCVVVGISVDCASRGDAVIHLRFTPPEGKAAAIRGGTDGWCAICPDGPVAWSRLADLVANGRTA